MIIGDTSYQLYPLRKLSVFQCILEIVMMGLGIVIDDESMNES